MQREIILDTETTGMDPLSGHRIVEIGCVELLQGSRTGKFFHCYLNPERDVPPEASRVHGLTDEFLKDKPVFAQIADELIAFLGDSPLVIHNAAFDMKFLNAEFQKVGFPALPMTRAVDTVLIARKKFPGSPANLDALCRRFCIDLSSRTKHGALLDAELLSEVYIEMTLGRQANLLLGNQEASSTTIIAVDANVPIPVREARMFAPTPEELDAHAAMLARIKAPLWLELETQS